MDFTKQIQNVASYVPDTKVQITKDEIYLYATNVVLNVGVQSFKELVHQLLYSKEFGDAKSIAQRFIFAFKIFFNFFSYKNQDERVKKDRLRTLQYLQVLYMKLLDTKDIEGYSDVKLILRTVRDKVGYFAIRIRYNITKARRREFIWL